MRIIKNSKDLSEEALILKLQQLMIKLEVLEEHYIFMQNINNILIDNLHVRVMKLEGYD